MFFLGEVLDKDLLKSLQKMLVESAKAFVCIYERDGSCISKEIHPSFSCSCFNNKKTDLTCDNEHCGILSSGLSKKLVGSTHTFRIRYPCRIDVILKPITYMRKVIGYISIGVPTAPFHSKSKPAILASVSPRFYTPEKNKFFRVPRNILEIQLKEFCKIISNHYSKKIKFSLGSSILSYEDYQSLFQSVINESPGCITMLKKVGNDLRIVFGNRLTLEYFRVNSLDEIKGRNLKDILPEYDNLYAVLFRAIETGETIRINEFVFKDPYTNNTSWWNLSAAPYYDNGKIIGSICIRNEITGHVLARNRLQELSNEFQEKSSQLEAVIDNMSEGLVFCDKNSHYVMWNKTALKFLNLPEKITYLEQTEKYFSLKEIDGKKIPLENYTIPRIFRGEVLKDLVILAEHNNESKDKRILLFNGKPIYDKDNNFMFGLATFSDITQIKEQSNRIEEQWNLINSALDQLEVPIFILTYPDLKFALSNKQTIFLLSTTINKKFNKNDILNENVKIFSRIIKNVDVEEFFLKIGRNDKQANSAPTITLNIHGEARYFSIISTPIQNIKSETTHIICSAFEITSSITYGKKLEEIARLKEEFFANVSHEFRTPLTVILGSLQMLTTSNLSAPIEVYQKKTTKYIAIMKQNCHRLVKLINNLLDVSRIQSGYLLLCLQKYDIVSYIKEITMSVSDYVGQKNLSLQFSSNVKEKILLFDLDKIERIVLNLLSNAVKFTPEGNKISVFVCDKKAFVEIRVIDTGVGIPNEKLDIIFERFRQVDNVLTRNNEGSGLGLSLVKSLVELHGGTIKVKSKVGKGTEFKITLPTSPVIDYIPLTENTQHGRAMKEVVNIEFSDLNLEQKKQ